QPLAEPGPEVDPVPLVLALEPGTTDAEDRPPAGEVVERRRELRGEPRVTEGVGADHEPEGRPLRHLRPPGEDRPALEDRALPRPTDAHQVVPGPQVRGAATLGAYGGIAEGRPAGRLGPQQEPDLDVAHVSPRGGRGRRRSGRGRTRAAGCGRPRR